MPSEAHPPPRRQYPIALQAAAFGVAYLLSAYLGAWLSVKPDHFAPFWPPAGLYLAVLLLAPIRQWPWFVTAAILGNIAFDLTAGKGLPISLLIVFGNSLSALCGAWAIRAILGGPPCMQRVRDIVVFAVIGAAISTTASASCGTVALHVLAGIAEPLHRLWLRWWCGDALSILIFTPIILTVLTNPSTFSFRAFFPRTPARIMLEKIGWSLLFLCVIWIVFLKSPRELISFSYLLWPLLIWAGLRFRMASIMAINLGIALFGAWVLSHEALMYTLINIASHHAATSLLFFLISIASSSLLIGAISHERNKHQAALRNSERQLRDMFDNTIDGILVADPATGRFVKANRAMCRMTGYTEEELRTMTVKDLHPVEIHDRIRQKFKGAADGTDPFASEITVLRKDGTIFHADINASPFVMGGRKLLLGVFRDVSERIQSKDALHKSEERYRELFENINNGVAVYEVIDGGRDFIFKDFNRAAERIDNDSREHLIGKSIFEVRPDVERFGLIDVFRTVYQTGKPAHHPVSLYRDNRLTGWYENYVYKLPSGEIVAVFDDVTSKKVAEERLRESEALLKQSQQVAQLGHYVFDPTTGTWTCSETLDAVFGIDHTFSKTVEGWLSIIHPDDRDTMQRYLTQHVLQEKNKFDRNYRIIRQSDGALRWVHGIGNLEFDTNGLPVKMFGIIQDITDRKRAEESLVESERRYRSIVENINDAFYIHDFDGNILDCNDNACKMTGYSRNELIGASLKKIDSPTEIHLMPARMRKLMIDGVVSFEGEHLRKDGSPVAVNVSGRIVSREGNGIVQSVVRDISERKLAHENMLKAQKLESLGMLAGGIAHDFNNLLSGIFGNIDLALDEAQRGNAKTAAKFLEKAMTVFERARDLTRQLLTFSKGGAPTKKKGDIGLTVRDTVHFALSGSNVLPDIRYPSGLWTCEYDPHQIGQVIDNMVINAKQAMPQGGMLTVTVDNCMIEPSSPTQLIPGPYVRITISDQGIGIPAEHLSKIFDPFFTTKQTGSGLGLATSWSIIKRHKGHIDVESVPGKGTTFFLYLPASPSDTIDADRENVRPNKGSGRILVMDDEPAIRDVATRMLNVLGYSVVTAQDGPEAITLFTNAHAGPTPFCAIILDLTIPGGMGGKEVARQMLTLDPNAVLIASSGYADDPVMADPRAFGFTASISKPYRKEEMGTLLTRVLQP